MPLRRWTRDARLTFAMRNPLGGFSRVPAAPALTLRDLWPGNPMVGERLVRNQSVFEGTVRPLHHLQWDSPGWPDAYRRWLQGFTWLRDLRELGAESARIKARSMVATWISQPAPDRPVADPSITGTRLAAWLSYYEFFAAAADDDFRQNLMAALIMEARSIMALMPEAAQGWRALAALKGLLAVAVAIPDHQEFLSRYLRLIDQEIEQQFLADGSHITRCPEDQFQAVRELAEMLSILQTARLPLPTRLMEAADRAAPALRAMRHGDGGLMLFNGSRERDPQLIEQVLTRASRSRVVASSLPESGYMRLTSGRTMLFADAAGPAPAGYDRTAHAGMLSFEFSSGRQRIIVNCGASTQRAWAEALHVPAAHSVLEMGGAGPLRRDQNGTILRRPTVTRAHASQDGAHWLHMTHDGYTPQGGGVYSRQIYLGKDGQTLRGEDALQGTDTRNFCVRFHLHPEITVEEIAHGFLLYTQEESWLFQANVPACVEDSIYLGSGQPVPSLQIVLYPPDPPAEPEADPAAEAEEDAERDLYTEADAEAEAASHAMQDYGEGSPYPSEQPAEDNAPYSPDMPQPQDQHRTEGAEAGYDSSSAPGYHDPASGLPYPEEEAGHTAPSGPSAPHAHEEDAFEPLLRDAPPADSWPYQTAGSAQADMAARPSQPEQAAPTMAQALFAEHEPSAGQHPTHQTPPGQSAQGQVRSGEAGPAHAASGQAAAGRPASGAASKTTPEAGPPPKPAMRPVRWALTLMTE
ncbi:heparinase II/III family protein [Acetobacter farinalis]|uniref:Heparinase II/III family protein n=1 Tax=Acetobacter farinalis TaxID=1260984 RepID=A0ABT3Q438_9PROT|nr:heparinase II/III family protein [Acetobacter farinalis]MCX2560024.1 heparinase II/III family protein [Acetobacter farinalis]NHO28680.1 heparinase [Acetobacter farinalis]